MSVLPWLKVPIIANASPRIDTATTVLVVILRLSARWARNAIGVRYTNPSIVLATRPAMRIAASGLSVRPKLNIAELRNNVPRRGIIAVRTPARSSEFPASTLAIDGAQE